MKSRKPRRSRRDRRRPVAPPAAVREDDGAPQSIEGLRSALALKLEMFMADWRRCPRRVCRRRRACQPNAAGCPSPRRHNRAPLTKEQMARRLAWLSRMLKQPQAGPAAGGGSGKPEKTV